MPTYDAIVIGSGFGGAVTAAKLTAHGYQVLLLEKGRRWRGGGDAAPSATVDRFGNPEHPLKQSTDLSYVMYRSVQTGAYGGGLYEDYLGDRFLVTVARGYGGGSLVYSQISLRAPSETFDSGGWKGAGLSRQRLDPYYAQAERSLLTFPSAWEDLPKRGAVIADAMARLGVSCEPARLANYRIATDADRDQPPVLNPSGRYVRPCNGCGYCSFGCVFDARQSLPLNYLARAEDSGRLDVRTDAAVDVIEPTAAGHRVEWQDLRTGASKSETSRAVIVAAGAINSPELLLRARDVHRTLPDLSAHLGRHVSANGDLALGAVFPRLPDDFKAELYKGHVMSLVSYHWWKEKRFVLEDLGSLPVGAAKYPLRAEGAGRYFGPELKALLKSDYARNVVGIGGMGIDGADGAVRLGKDGLATVDWTSRLAPGDATFDVLENIRAASQAVVRAGDGELLHGREWQDRRRIVSVHPLGGCRMGRSKDDGVVDQRGMVFGHPGLFVIDGSIMPGAIGVNPSLTIAACAEALSDDVVRWLRP